MYEHTSATILNINLTFKKKNSNWYAAYKKNLIINITIDNEDAKQTLSQYLLQWLLHT